MKCPTLKEIKSLFNCTCYQDKTISSRITYFIGGYFEGLGDKGNSSSVSFSNIILYPIINFTVSNNEVQSITYNIYQHKSKTHHMYVDVSDNWPNDPSQQKMINSIKNNLKYIKLKLIS